MDTDCGNEATAKQAFETAIGSSKAVFIAGSELTKCRCRFDLLGVMWTVIGHDWERPSASIVDLILARSSPAGILCLHDGRDIRVNPDITETIAAVRNVVRILKDQGYIFETVTDILTPS